MEPSLPRQGRRARGLLPAPRGFTVTWIWWSWVYPGGAREEVKVSRKEAAEGPGRGTGRVDAGSCALILESTVSSQECDWVWGAEVAVSLRAVREVDVLSPVGGCRWAPGCTPSPPRAPQLCLCLPWEMHSRRQAS